MVVIAKDKRRRTRRNQVGGAGASLESDISQACVLLFAPHVGPSVGATYLQTVVAHRGMKSECFS